MGRRSWKRVFLPPLVALFFMLDACIRRLVPEKCAQLTVDLASGTRTASDGCLCLQTASGSERGHADSLTWAQSPAGQGTRV